MAMQIRELLNWSRNRKRLASLLVVATLGVGVLIGTVITGGVGASRATYETGAKTLVVPDPIVMSNTFSGIVTKVEPAVVNISTIQVVQPRAQVRRVPPGTPGVTPKPRGGGNDEDPDMQDFFNRFFDNPDQGQDQSERSLGSGIVVDPKGYILTNNHVIDQATKITVQLNGDPRPYQAKLIGTDLETDLAVIKIDVPHDLPFAKLGNSDGVQVGDWVLAIGSPFGLNATVTAGIVSAKDRDDSQIGSTGGRRKQFQRFLQTDAAINPGNSGGPLVDMAGQVVGINTAIMTGSRSMGNEGVGFALPSNAAINVYNQIVTKGHVTRGSIGITFLEGDSTNPIVLHSLGAEYGIVIGSVEPNGPAAKAGIKAEDVITRVNGKPIHTGNDLVDPIADTPVGNKVQLTYLRNKQPHEVSVEVGDRVKIFPDQAQNEDATTNTPAAAEFGIHVGELTPELAKQAGVDVKQGVFVTRPSDPASFGEDLNIQRGQVIVGINDQPINNMSDYKRAIESLKPGQDVVFKVLQGGTSGMVTRLLAGVVPSSK